jgi:hypothetical protein
VSGGRRIKGVVVAILLASGCTGGTEPREAVAEIRLQLARDTILIGDSTEVAADLRDGARGIIVGVLPAWRSSSPSVATVRAVGTLPSAAITAVSPGRVEITATVGRTVGRATLTVLPLSAFDINVEQAQWTQAIQTPSGSIPMVLDGNAAVVNVLLSTTVPGRASGNLVLTVRDNSGAVVHRDTVVVRPITARTTYADPSAQFLVPAGVIRPGLSWDVVRDPAGQQRDGNASNDRFPRGGPASLVTVSVPPMHVRFVPLTLASHNGVRATLTPSATTDLLSMVVRVMPWSRLTTSIAPPLTTTARFGDGDVGGTYSFWSTVLGDVQQIARTADERFRDAFWVAIAPVPSGFRSFEFGGLAFLPGPVVGVADGSRVSAILAADGSFAASAVAHEIGHNLGRRHAPCGGPTDVDPEYPLLSGWIGTPGHDVAGWAMGASVSALPRSPATGDLMSYCPPTWIGAYTYEALIAALRAKLGTAMMPAAREPVVVVSGALRAGVLTIRRVVRLIASPTTGDAGDADITLLDSDHRAIATRRIALQQLDHDAGQLFSVALPRHDVETDRIAAVRVRTRDGTWTQRVPR